MKSALPKVLHKIAGLPMVAHVAKAAEAAGGEIALVIGHGADQLRGGRAIFRAERRDLRPGKTARHRARGAGRARGDRERL